MAVHYKISSQWTAYAFATAVSYQGGFLDSTIEGFHKLLGLNSYGRHAIARNGSHLIYDLKQAQGRAVECAEESRVPRPDVRTALQRHLTTRSDGRCRWRPR